MASELITGLGIFKSLFDIAKGLKDINDVATRNAAVIELQEKIFSAQEAQFALVERVRDAEAEVAHLKAWDAEKKRYGLKDFGSGTFAYSLKPEASDGEPIHHACAKCYKQGHIVILQFQHQNYLQQGVYKCQQCETDISLGTPAHPPDGRGNDNDDWRAT